MLESWEQLRNQERVREDLRGSNGRWGGGREKEGRKRGRGREEDREGEGGWCSPGVGRSCLLLSPVLDTQNQLVEAVHMLEAGLVSD